MIYFSDRQEESQIDWEEKSYKKRHRNRKIVLQSRDLTLLSSRLIYIRNPKNGSGMLQSLRDLSAPLQNSYEIMTKEQPIKVSI